MGAALLCMLVFTQAVCLVVQASCQLKEEGNKFFKSQNFAAAAEKYMRAKSNLDTSSRADMQDLHRRCTLNLANCYLNLGKFTNCIEECTQVLKGAVTSGSQTSSASMQLHASFLFLWWMYGSRGR